MDSYDSEQLKKSDDPLAARKGNMMNILKRASEYLVLENYTAAMMLFEKIKMMSIKNGYLYMFDINERDLCLIDYALIKTYATNELYFSKGVQCLKKVLENATTFPPLYYGIAVLLYKQQRIIEAKYVINQALDYLCYIRRDDFFKANWPCSDVEITESNVTVLIKMLESLRKDCINSEMKECGDDYYDASLEDKAKIVKEKILNKFYCESCHDFSVTSKQTVNIPLNNGKDFYDIIQCLASKVNENILIQEKIQNMENERDDTINDKLNLILLKLEENQKFQEEIHNLEYEVKSQKDAAMDLEKHNALQDESKDFDPIKLETIIEELNKTLKNQEETLQMQEKRIEYLESSLTKQYLQFHLSQKQEITKHVNKSVHMVSNLNLALPYLTWCSAPTADECGKSIIEWERHLQYVKEQSHAVDNFYNTCLKQIKKVDCCTEIEDPHLCSDITEPRDILHDNYIPAVHYFLKKDYEMIGRHQQSPQVPMHYQYNQPGGPLPQFNKSSTFNNSIFHIPNGLISSHRQSIIVDTTANTKSWELSPNYNQTKVVKTDAKLNIIPDVSGKKVEVLTDQKLDTPSEQRCNEPDKNTFFSMGPFKSETEDKIVAVSYKLNAQSNVFNAEADAISGEKDKETEIQKNQKLPTNTFATIPKDDAVATTSCNNSDLDIDVTNLNDSFQNRDEHNTSAVINAVGGNKFHNLFLKVKSRIIDYREEEVLIALKSVRQKKVKLTGMSLSNIVEIVQEELKGTEHNTCIDTSTKRTIKQDSNGETNNSNICVFCYEPYDETSKTILKCQHIFHLKCIEHWCTTNCICPVCLMYIM